MPGAMARLPATRSLPGSLALHATRGAHPTMRLDGFLRSTDSGYQHAEPPIHGDKFIRKMATYGQVRPSCSFTSESRVSRPAGERPVMDASNLPNPFMDARGDLKEGTLSVPAPPTSVDNTYVRLMANESLMLPSERYKEAKQIKESEQKFREDKESLLRYGKRMKILERHFPSGVVGVDGPMIPGTQLYADRRSHFIHQEDGQAFRGERRHDHLHSQRCADDATAARRYGSDAQLPRSRDIGIVRKRVDPELHPRRFEDTHERLFPGDLGPTWSPQRAAKMRELDTGGRNHNIISGVSNAVEFKVANFKEKS